MVAGIVGQVHHDTARFLNITKSESGAILAATQIELDEFVKWHYKSGLRSPNGQNHIIQSCQLFLTTGSAGVNNKLWYRSGEQSFSSIVDTNSTTAPNVTYTQSGGLNVTGKQAYLNSVFNCSDLSTNDCSLCLYNLTANANTDLIGDGASTSSRLLIHPQYGTLGSTTQLTSYFDVGNNSATGRISGSISGNCQGLWVGSKSGSTQVLRNKTNQIARSTIMATTGQTFPASPILIMSAGPADTPGAKSIGGFAIGKAISESLMTDLNTAWRKLQTSVSASRNF